MLKAIFKLKPYFRLAVSSVLALLLVSLIHSEAIEFLQDTNQPDLIAPVYFVKWGLIVVVLLMASIYFKKISKKHRAVAEEPEAAPYVSKQHQEILNKDKLMSKGDKILKR